MERTLEPEVMEDAEQAAAYAAADFAAVNQGFADRFLAALPPAWGGHVLDIGCGPADIPIRLVRARPMLRVTALDASAPMLALARRDIAAAGLTERIAILQARLPDLPLRAHTFDAVISNSVLHHLPDPLLFWRALQRMGRRGVPILVMDLFRPPTVAAAQALVDAAAVNEHPVLRRDFLHSLLAAFTLDEVIAQLRAADLGHLTAGIVSERHLVVAGRLPAGDG